LSQAYTVAIVGVKQGIQAVDGAQAGLIELRPEEYSEGTPERESVSVLQEFCQLLENKLLPFTKVGSEVGLNEGCAKLVELGFVQGMENLPDPLQGM
jgi:hypothetical protein